MFNHITVIVNPIAGGKKDKKKLIQLLLAQLSSNGRKVSVRCTTKKGDATLFAREAVDENVNLVVVVGGDGTVNEAGSALVKTGVPIAIIPQGSGNGLARTLRIPADVKSASGLIAAGVVSDIDVGNANRHYFFMLMGVGFDALIGQKFNEYSARGPLPYFYLGAREYFTYQPPRVHLSFANRRVELTPFMITVANAQQFGNNALIAPHAVLNDGLLDICIVNRLRVIDLVAALPKLFTGRIGDFSGVEFHQAAAARLERERADFINIDGEAVLEEAIVDISVLPRSLKVVTPRVCPALAP
ncbi:MAG TPA: YegS/Rv2252/BmrU family lipid kinase [bacterium]